MLLKSIPPLITAMLFSLSLHADPMRITISIPGPGATAYLPIELISKIGTDKAEGASLKILFSSSGGAAISEMLTNNADFAVVGLPSAMSNRLKDNRIIALAAVNDLPLYVLLVRQELEGKVRKISDLKGKAIGLHGESATTKTTSHQVLELILRRGGVPPDSYRTVTVGRRWESESMMLKTGAVDALIADEPHASKMIEEKVAFSLLHLGNPETRRLYAGAGFLRGALIGRSDKKDAEPEKYQTMVKIIQRTLKWISEHSPEEVTDSLGITNPDEKQRMIKLLKSQPRQFSKDGKFSNQQLAETDIFFIDSQKGNTAAESFRIESMIVDHWAGRKN
jgi:NitT/TauT family transport system substrate-binding protein